MKSEFNPTEPGSYYVLGDQKKPEVRVVFMHGATGNAAWLENNARVLERELPSAEIIVPNAPYARTPSTPIDEFKAQITGPGFVWYPGTNEEWDLYVSGEDPFDKLLVKTLDENEAPVVLFGVSQGGFRASLHFMTTPRFYAGLILHGSALTALVPTGDESRYTPENVLPYYSDKMNPKAPRVCTMLGAFDWAAVRGYKQLFGENGIVTMHKRNAEILEKHGVGTAVDFKILREHSPHKGSMRQAAAHIRNLLPDLRRD